MGYHIKGLDVDMQNVLFIFYYYLLFFTEKYKKTAFLMTPKFAGRS